MSTATKVEAVHGEVEIARGPLGGTQLAIIELNAVTDRVDAVACVGLTKPMLRTLIDKLQHHLKEVES